MQVAAVMSSSAEDLIQEIVSWLTGLDVQDFNVVPYDDGHWLFNISHVQFWIVGHSGEVGSVRIEHIPDTKLEKGRSEQIIKSFQNSVLE